MRYNPLAKSLDTTSLNMSSYPFASICILLADKNFIWFDTSDKTSGESLIYVGMDLEYLTFNVKL